MINTAEFIVGGIEHAASVSINAQDPPDAIQSEIVQAVKNVDQGDGVLILTDMFGGTPSNLSLSLLPNGRVEVLSGANLPIIIKLLQHRDSLELSDLARTVWAYGRKSINLASEVLNRRPKD